MKIINKMLIMLVVVSMTLLSSVALADADTAYDISTGSVVLENTSGNIIITGSSKENTITVKNGTYNITLQDVSVDVSAKSNTAAFMIDSNAVVNLTLVGENTLKSGSGCAGLQLNVSGEDNGAVIIDGSGKLSAFGGSKSAGMGGKSLSRNGSVTINGGTVYAEGNGGGAGIGGGNNGSSYKSTDGGIINIMGGTVTAIGKSGASGIGGGNHGDGGAITIGGNAVIELATGESGGAGIGSGIGSSKDADKGPGHVNGGTITVQGGLIKNAIGSWCGAGIGGGMYSDSGTVTINGGTIELSSGGDGTAGSTHHGAAGIGAGYQGHADITINGGVIEQALGAFSGAGIGSGPVANTDKRPNVTLATSSKVNITGGTIELARGGEFGGAGIGAGSATDSCTINISGGNIHAVGAASTEDAKAGGAGIGSSGYKVTKYMRKSDNIDINISGGKVYAEGGWGASGIGSGSDNCTVNDITISGGTSVTAVADGTKFAIDTEKGAIKRDDFAQPVLQGTYTLPHRGLETSVVKDGNPVRTVQLPDGYRSFAVDVDDAGTYMVKANDMVFAMKASEQTETDVQNDENIYKFDVSETILSDNDFLYPISEDAITDDVKVVEVQAHDPYVLTNNYAYIFGRDDTRMEPQSNMLRGEACAVLYRLLKQNHKLGGYVFDAESESTLLPGLKGRWDRSAAEYAAYVGVYPTDGTVVYLDNEIRRGEAFRLMAIELGFTEQTNLTEEQYAQILIDRGYVKGYEDGTIRLDNFITRAEFCKIYNLVIGRSEARLEMADGTPVTSETYGFTDVDGFWGTGDMLRATSAYDENGFVDMEKRGNRNELDDYTE